MDDGTPTVRQAYDAATCPACGSKTQVVNSRPEEVQGFSTYRRRRACVKCDYRFNTVEVHLALVEIAELKELIKELEDGG